MNKIIDIINTFLKSNITNEKLIKMYYDIGKILSNKDEKYIEKLEYKLKIKYGIIIGFTKRNLINMINFYKSNTYLENKNKLWKDIINMNYTKTNKNYVLEEMIELKKKVEEEI